jgi:hypothetical protein
MPGFAIDDTARWWDTEFTNFCFTIYAEQATVPFPLPAGAEVLTDAYLIEGPFADCTVCDVSSSSSSLDSSSSSSIDSSSSSSSSSLDSSSSSSIQYSSSSSGECQQCCGCECVKLALNINGTPTATDVSQLDNQYSSTTGGGTGLSTTQDYVGGGSHYNGGGNEYCLFHSTAEVADPGEKGCTHSVGLNDFNGCLNLEDNDFDIRLAIYITASNISAGSSLVSKWSNPSNLPDSGRSWILGYTDAFISPVLGNYGFYFSWSDDGTNYSQLDFEFGASGNPEPTEDTWVEVRVARSGSTIAVYFDGERMTITSSDFSGGTAGATFYPTNEPVLFGNDLETVASAFTNGFSGYMDYLFISLGCTPDLDPYTPEILPFVPPYYIGNLGPNSSSSSSEPYVDSSSSTSSELFSASSLSSSSSSELFSASSLSSSSSSSELYSESTESSSSSSSEGYSESSLSSNSSSSSSSSSELYSESTESSSSSSSSGDNSSSSSSSSEDYSSSSSSSSSGGGGYDNTHSFYSDGSNDYLRTDSGYSSWGNQFTISFFMKWVTSNQSKAFVKGNSGSNTWCYCRPDTGGSIRLIIYKPSDSAIQTGQLGLDDNAWHHVVMRADTGTGDAQIIVDNVVRASSTTITGTLASPTSYIQAMEVNSYYDEFIITKGYDDPSDFADYSGGDPCPIEPLVTTFIHYKADDVSALTTIPDSSGNGNDGEFFNSTLANAITTVVPC